MYRKSTTRRDRSQRPRRGRLLSPPSSAGRTITDTLISPPPPILDGEIPKRKFSCARRAVAPAPRGIVRLADARHKYRASLLVLGKAAKDTEAHVLVRTHSRNRDARPVLLARKRQGNFQLQEAAEGKTPRDERRDSREKLATAAILRPLGPIRADRDGWVGLRAAQAGRKLHALARRPAAISGMEALQGRVRT